MSQLLEIFPGVEESYYVRFLVESELMEIEEAASALLGYKKPVTTVSCIVLVVYVHVPSLLSSKCMCMHTS